MKGSIIDQRKILNFRVRALFLAFTLLFLLPLSAQKNSPKRDQLEREIQLTEKLLEDSQNKEGEALGKLRILNRQIKLRKKLISRTLLSIETESNKIIELDGITRQLEEDVKEMSLSYSRMVQLSQRNYLAQNFWLMILSSRNITDAYHRFTYFRQFSNFKRRQIEAINKTEIYLQSKSEQLKESIEKNQGLLLIKENENEKLAVSVKRQQKLLKDTKRQSRVIKNRLAIRKGRLKKLIKEDQNTFLLKPGNIDDEYAENFRKRKGLLPWPIPPQNVVITKQYGEDEDEFGNRVFNDGIHMASSQGQPVKAVYSGKVTAVTRLPMSGTVIILEHGKYRTVYANLVKTHVKKGDLVSENQILGSVRQDPRTGENSFNFLIYLIPDKFLNPESWLLDK
ncbi:MAG: peptidoglycan DD-metalloendopeptidase family protein [Bacteroidia bacterium]|nr:peptidoglycan DD-metalloendopeptidase family protein [Bacteroidia bacterium]